MQAGTGKAEPQVWAGHRAWWISVGSMNARPWHGL